MSTLSTANIESKAANTPPVIKDVNGTECGTFCRAWVNFNGTGTVAIRDSFNVSTITDNGTGDYTVNFTNAFANANYALTGTSGGQGGTSNGAVYQLDQSAAKTTSACRIALLTTAGSLIDTPQIAIAFFGD